MSTPAEINKNVIVMQHHGDLKQVLGYLLPHIKEKDNPEWLEEIRDKKKSDHGRSISDKLTGPFIVSKICEITEGKALICTDVGQHQMWAAQYYTYTKPRTLMTSGGLGTMGYGLGAAIGTKCGNPDKIVVNIAGDGCFRMNMNELATAVRSNIPVIEVVFNNHVLGMVRQWQNLFYEERYSHTTLQDKVDFVKVAEAMGAMGIRVTRPEEFEPAFRKAIEAGVPVVIDCILDSDDMVFPMVPAGKPNSEVFDETDMAAGK